MILHMPHAAPKPLGARLLSRRGETDCDEHDQPRSTGPNAVGVVEHVDWYGLFQGYNYGVVFHDHGGVWVNIDESDFDRFPDDYEWLDMG